MDEQTCVCGANMCVARWMSRHVCVWGDGWTIRGHHHGWVGRYVIRGRGAGPGGGGQVMSLRAGGAWGGGGHHGWVDVA